MCPAWCRKISNRTAIAAQAYVRPTGNANASPMTANEDNAKGR